MIAATIGFLNVYSDKNVFCSCVQNATRLSSVGCHISVMSCPHTQRARNRKLSKRQSTRHGGDTYQAGGKHPRLGRREHHALDVFVALQLLQRLLNGG